MTNPVFLWYDNQKAVKRRVDRSEHHRESALVGADMEGMVENGLGAAHRSVNTPRLRRAHPLQ